MLLEKIVGDIPGYWFMFEFSVDDDGEEPATGVVALFTRTKLWVSV